MELEIATNHDRFLNHPDAFAGAAHEAHAAGEIPFHMRATHLEPFAHRLLRMRVEGAVSAEMTAILTPDALEFIQALEDNFGERRRELLDRRHVRALRLARGLERLGFATETADVRGIDWQIAPAPQDLQRRQVEIAGPAERQFMIEALGSAADTFIADLEDSTSPTWENVIVAQTNLCGAVRRQLGVAKDHQPTLMMRPRGWHLEEHNLTYDGDPVSASLVDFGLYVFHNARELVERGSAPYFYLPKLESRHEARLWNDVFNFAQDRLGLSRGTIRASVLIETVQAAFEMEEILFELREHAAGLSTGRHDYLFSMIKLFSESRDLIFPDRSQLTMSLPFMQSFSELLIATCRKRGAPAVGGMSSLLPTSQDARAGERLRADKETEARMGYDGTWVAHAEMVATTREIFETTERGELRESFAIRAEELLPKKIAGGRVTEEGVSQNIAISLHYICSWLQGHGAAAIDDGLEDAATAELARAELWQWVRFEVTLTEGTRLTRNEFRRRLESERARFAGHAERCRLSDACDILEKLVTAQNFPEFMTTVAYEKLC